MYYVALVRLASSVEEGTYTWTLLVVGDFDLGVPGRQQLDVYHVS